MTPETLGEDRHLRVLGLSFAYREANVKKLEAAGARVITPLREAPGLFKLAFVRDPFGVKLELVEDVELLGFTISTCVCRIPKRRVVRAGVRRRAA